MNSGMALKKFFVFKFKELNISLSIFCRLYNVDRTTIHRWSIKYDNGEFEFDLYLGRSPGLEIRILF